MSDHNDEEKNASETFEKENYMDSAKKAKSMDLFPGKVKDVLQSDHESILTCDNQVKMSLSALSDKILHVKFAPDGHLGDDFSYAALPENFPQKTAPKLSKKGDFFHFTTDSLQGKISQKGLLLTISDSEGNVMSECEEKGFPLGTR